MHYGATAFAKASGLITIERLRGSVHQRRRLGQRVGLSAKDKLQVQRLYKCGTTATTLAPSGMLNSYLRNRKLVLCVCDVIIYELLLVCELQKSAQ